MENGSIQKIIDNQRSHELNDNARFEAGEKNFETIKNTMVTMSTDIKDIKDVIIGKKLNGDKVSDGLVGEIKEHTEKIKEHEELLEFSRFFKNNKKAVIAAFILLIALIGHAGVFSILKLYTTFLK